MYLQWWILLLAALMITAYSIIYFLEWKHPRYMLPHVHHSVKLWLQGCLNTSASAFTSFLFASYLFFISKHFTGLFGGITDNVWLHFILSFIFLDFIIYWWHRINHIFSGLWKFHVLHHKEQELNVFSTFHFDPKEILISTSWRLILLPLMGIAPAALLIYNAVFFSVILFHHSNFKLSFFWDKLLSKVIVTPGLHHLHHSVKLKESNSNYGSVFSFWDKIFGSHTEWKKQEIRYGVDEGETVELGG